MKVVKTPTMTGAFNVLKMKPKPLKLRIEFEKGKQIETEKVYR